MNTQPQTRREFLQTATRTVLLGAVGLLSAVLVRRRQNCTTRGGCRDCNLADNCVLPWKEPRR